MLNISVPYLTVFWSLLWLVNFLFLFCIKDKQKLATEVNLPETPKTDNTPLTNQVPVPLYNCKAYIKIYIKEITTNAAQL